VTAAAIADSLSGARRTGVFLPDYPGSIPSTLDEAYFVQEAMIARTADAVVGWKVAMIKDEFRDRFDAPRFAGPIFARTLVGSGEQPARLRAIPGGFCAVEAEFAIQLARDIPADLPADTPLEPYLGAVHAGIELAGSPVTRLTELGPGATISDLGNSLGVVIGDPIASFGDRPLDRELVSLSIDGIGVGQGSAANVPGGPLAAIRFLVTHLAKRGRSLSAGNWVSTGATTGIHPAATGATACAAFSGGARARLDISPC
jgi:2-keto-4-pentenoate hydratase